MPVYDYVIVGGGMSGLALARELIVGGLTKASSLLVIDARTSYQRDKVWSFWNVKNEDYSKYQMLSWTKFSIIESTNRIEVKSPFPYISIDSGKYYEYHIELIKNDHNTTLLTNTEVVTIDQVSSIVHIYTSKGETIKSHQVFDFRILRELPTHKFTLLQHFKGIEIITTKPVFDPNCVILMDFNTSQKWGLQFIYILPQSPTEAMIEATWFSSNLVDPEVYDQQLENYLTKAGLDNYEVKYSETGVIPMSTEYQQESSFSNFLAIGTRGGITRPSTGYTFLTAQWHAKELSQFISTEKSNNFPKMRSSWTDFLDEILLRVLTKHPHLGPTLFYYLFKRNKPERIIKFLSGISSFGEDLIIMIKVPHKWAFLKEGFFEFITRLKFWK